MCDFLSVLINKDADKELKIWVGDLRSHSATVEQHKLSHDVYCEVEWTNEDEKYLTVRVGQDDTEKGHTENWYRSIILSQWKNRNDFIIHCLKFSNGPRAYLQGCTGLKELPAGFNPKEYADLRGCTGLNRKKVEKQLTCRIYW